MKTAKQRRKFARSSLSDKSVSSPPPKHPRTAMRMVDSIDAAWDEDNNDDMDLPAGARWEPWNAKLGPKKSKTAEKISWTGRPPEEKVRKRQCAILKENQAP